MADIKDIAEGTVFPRAIEAAGREMRRAVSAGCTSDDSVKAAVIAYAREVLEIERDVGLTEPTGDAL